ncbi:uncharacterized protein Tco025E_09585, partial [Trypanosoma conorhini]
GTNAVDFPPNNRARQNVAASLAPWAFHWRFLRLCGDAELNQGPVLRIARRNAGGLERTKRTPPEKRLKEGQVALRVLFETQFAVKECGRFCSNSFSAFWFGANAPWRRRPALLQAGISALTGPRKEERFTRDGRGRIVYSGPAPSGRSHGLQHLGA